MDLTWDGGRLQREKFDPRSNCRYINSCLGYSEYGEFIMASTLLPTTADTNVEMENIEIIIELHDKRN